MITVQANAAALLQALGNTGREVASALHQRGITGVRGQCGACPLAEYLLRSDLDLEAVDVDGTTMLWFRGEDGVRHVEYVDLPEACSEFVYQFDLGEYPELDKAVQR